MVISSDKWDRTFLRPAVSRLHAAQQAAAESVKARRNPASTPRSNFLTTCVASCRLKMTLKRRGELKGAQEQLIQDRMFRGA